MMLMEDDVGNELLSLGTPKILIICCTPSVGLFHTNTNISTNTTANTNTNSYVVAAVAVVAVVAALAVD